MVEAHQEVKVKDKVPLSKAMKDGSELLVLGMGGVFLFLLILVFLMNISAKFFTKYAHLFPEQEVKQAARPAAKTGKADEEIAVAIAAMTAHTR